MEEMKTLNAVEITTQTLVGHLFDEEKGLFPRGNCFSMECEDSKCYRILNFGVENLELLLRIGIVKFPIKISPLSEKHAVIMDERIPNRFYWRELCSSCTPIELLPIPQRIEYEMKFKRGHCKIIVPGLQVNNVGSLINGESI